MCLILASLVLPLIMQAGGGEDVPLFVNDSSRRLHSESGLSLIVPPGWTCLASVADEIHLCPITRLSSRGRATMTLARQAEQPELAGLKQTRFHDWDAWESMEVANARAGSADSGALSVFRMMIQHPTGWVCFTYTLPRETKSLPDSIRQYVDCIEIGGHQQLKGPVK